MKKFKWHLYYAQVLRNFDVRRPGMAPGGAVPHPALRADLSRQGEVKIQAGGD